MSIKNYNLDFIKKKNKEINSILNNTDTERDLQVKLNNIMYVFSILIIFVVHDVPKFDQPFLLNLTKEINNILNSNLSYVEVYHILVHLKKNKSILKKLIDNNNLSNDLSNNKINTKFINIEQRGGFGFIKKLLGWTEETSTKNKTIDVLQLILDLGQIPLTVLDYVGVGLLLNLPFDIANLLLSILKGDMKDVMFNLIQFIPFAGSIIGLPGKYINRYNKWKKRYEKFERAKNMLVSPTQYPTQYPNQYPNQYRSQYPYQ